MKVFHTQDLPRTPEALEKKYSESERLHIYNGLDCALTVDILQQVRQQLDNVTSSTYQFSLSLQAPILEMNLRGLLVDEHRRQQFLREAKADVEKLTARLTRIVTEGMSLPMFNWRSPQDIKHFLYEVMGLPEQIHRKTKKPTVDRDALEKLTKYFYAEPIINHILTLRDYKKLIEVLETAVDPDGRIRTSFNIGGTETGRLSSSASPFDTGGNMQNITENLRRIFIADPGKKFIYADLEQAESRAIGAMIWNIFHDGKYLDVCENSDPHTSVAKLIWRDLGWTGNPKRDREIADQKFYRHFSYRDFSKRAGHASNYGGLPPTIAKVLKVPTKLIDEFQSAYFAEFPGLRSYHHWVAKELQLTGQLTTPLGRRRYFFGRRDSDETVREAIAQIPQSMVADIMNQGILNVWRHERRVSLHLQVHDALLGQYNEEQEDELVPIIRKHIQIPVQLEHGRTLVIPNDVKTGWNWGNSRDLYGNLVNPDGLEKYKGHDSRTRQYDPSVSGLDRRLL